MTRVVGLIVAVAGKRYVQSGDDAVKIKNINTRNKGYMHLIDWNHESMSIVKLTRY
ncbi:Hypothetical protein CINCED_3A007082 [Cinara cedri]|uniref:Uncharacterized protein n=1 Tax=Cinara cedri TaxID=506608 RepID=A0A5E4NCN6_9HEMI|nr:Hypothetical protein CINCED_3A007082 [Cinara cedri]